MMPTARVIRVDPIPEDIPLGYRRGVKVGCPWCSGTHWHGWPSAADDGHRESPCSPSGRNGKFYRIQFPAQKENHR